MKLQPQHLKCFWNKKNILFVSFVLIFAIGIGATTAWLTANQGEKTYVFEGANVKADIAGNIDSEYTKISNILGENHGNTDGFYRFVPVFAWVQAKSSPKIVHSKKPVVNADYTVSITGENWVKGEDGYWYYTLPVAGKVNGTPGRTSNLYVEIKKVEGKAPEGYVLDVELISNIIQANPPKTWQEAWGADYANVKLDEPQYRPEKMKTKSFLTTIATFNIRQEGTAGDSNEHGWETTNDTSSTRKEQVIKYINGTRQNTQTNHLGKEIMCLQEVTNDTQKEHIVAGLAEKYGYVYYQRDKNNDGEGLMTIYDKTVYDKISDDVFWLSETPDTAYSKSWESKHIRICVVVTLRHKETGMTLNVFNVHLDHHSVLARKKGLQLVLNRMSQYEGTHNVLAGDFNVDYRDDCYTTVTNAMKDTLKGKTGALYRTLNIWKGDNVSYGWEFETDMDNTKGPIDFIFVDKGSSTKIQSGYVDTQVRWDIAGSGKYLSDHYAVISEVYFYE